MPAALLVAIQIITGLSANATTIATITEAITGLTKLIPLAVQLGEQFYTGIKNIIVVLKGNTSDAEVLAALDALDKQTDEEFDKLAAEADPAAAAAGKAAADAAAGAGEATQQPGDPNKPANPLSGG